MFADIGGKFTLAVTRRSDGSVGVVRVANAGKGLSGGVGAELDAGPVRFSLGADGGVMKRFQVSAGWDFPDERTASKFLKHALRNAVRLKRGRPRGTRPSMRVRCGRRSVSTWARPSMTIATR